MRRIFIVLMVSLLSLGMFSPALASSVEVAVVDVTAPTGTVTLQPGYSASIVINMSVTGNQAGTATFKVNRDWSLSGGVFAGSNPQTFTVELRAAQDPATTFTTNGTVTVAAGQAAGSFTLAAGAFDITNTNTTGAKLAAGASSTYLVVVEEPPAPSDTTPPVIIITTPEDGAEYPQNAVVLADWSAADEVGGSGLKSASGTVASGMAIDTAILGTKTFTVEAEDNAGNEASKTVTYSVIDVTPPVITINTPVEGAKYLLNQVVLADWSAEDEEGGSGLKSASGTVDDGAAIDTSTVGAKTFTVEAEDNAGNKATKTVTYNVCYDFSGILQPINADGSSIFKLKSTIPVKFQLWDADGKPVSGAVATIYVAKKSNGTYGDEIEAVSTAAATTGNLFRYDFTCEQYIFNLATKNLTAGTWKIIICLDDGTKHSVDVGLR